jgi:hypothetical protein
MVRAPGRSSSVNPAGPLDFVPQQAVRWLSPTELGRSALARLVAGIFGAYSDKRELQQGGVFEQSVFVHDGDDLWLDFVADTGDGFDATYSVATMLAAEQLAVSTPDGDSATLPRGSVLVMGGDQVYPSGNTAAYEERTTKVFGAALPVAPAPRPAMYAIPGNHDWYDGLTAFLRVFAQREDIGGWKTAQQRSYFALKLPHRWWLFAVDIQLDTYIDKPQLLYFKEVAAQLGKGDGIILCTARPSWYDVGRGDPSSMKRLEYFIKMVVAGTDARVRLVLTGDAHHYARYLSRDTGQTLVTCGVGGAFTAATHDLPDDIALAPRLSNPDVDGYTGDDGVPPVTYERVEDTWPTRQRSRQLAWGVFKLPFRNPGFWGLVGGTHAAFTAALLSANVMWSAALGALILGGAVGFTDRVRGGWGRRLRYAIPHGLAQLGLSVGTYAAWDSVTSGWPPLAAVTLAVPVVAIVTGLISAEVVAAYLLLASLNRAHVNELFAAQSIEDYKGFARLHIGPHGVTVHPVVVERVCRDWRRPQTASATPQSTGAAGGPVLEPVTPLAPRFAEPPFTVPRDVPT